MTCVRGDETSKVTHEWPEVNEEGRGEKKEVSLLEKLLLVTSK